MEKEVKVKIARIVAAALLLAAAVAVESFAALPMWALLLVYLVPYLVAGYDVLWEAAEGVAEGELLDEDFLMAIATMGALAIGFLPGAESEFPEAVLVMLLFQVGEMMEDIAAGRSRRSVTALMDLRPDTARVRRDGQVVTVAPDQVAVGEVIEVNPGERVPLDGVCLAGNSSLDTVALTGESVPRTMREGDEVISGCVNLSGVIAVRVTKSAGDSTATKIVQLVEHASESKSRSEGFVRRLAHIYTPIVVAGAVLLAVVPPFFASGGWMAAFPTWLYRALVFLVVSCPCALVVSVPLAFFGGIGAASKRGILVKGANYIEALTRVKTVALDKTGTLTQGTFQVVAVHPSEIGETELLHLAAHVERHSSHPIAMSLKMAYENEADDCAVEQVHELAGHGVSAVVNGRRVALGNEKMMAQEGAVFEPCHEHPAGTMVHVAVDGRYAGHIVIADTVKPDARQAVEALRRQGVERTVMLTGDSEQVAAWVAQQVGVDGYHAALLPAGKVERVEALLGEKQRDSDLVAFVGDGLNDAPVLARADVGIAMGAMGSDAAIEAADVVLMDDQPAKISLAMRIARRTQAIAWQCVWMSLGVKVLILILGALGFANLWLAVVGDVGVLILAVANAMRALTAPKE